MTKKICISGYYGFDNFGDETILKILIENLKSEYSNTDITVFSSNPQKTMELYKVNSVKSFDIKNVIKEIKNCDCIISGGGSLLQDVTSRKSLIYYLGIIATALFLKKKIIIFAQGIGPIKNSLLKILTMYILKKASYISVRDEKSLELLKHWNINSILCSDPVWNLKINNKTKQNKLGVQLRNFPSADEDFLLSLAKCINQHYKDKEIDILSLQNKLDMNICKHFKDILEKLNPLIKVKVIENTSNEKIINDISSLDTLIAMRYHACLIAIKSEVKLLPISYDIKVSQLAKEFDLKFIDIENKETIQSIVKEFTSSEIQYDKNKTDSLKYNFEELKKVIL